MHAALAVAVVLFLPAQVPGKRPTAPAGQVIPPDPAWKQLGRSLWIDPKERRLYLRAKVVLRDGFLEHLMCLKGTKEQLRRFCATLDAETQPEIHGGLAGDPRRAGVANLCNSSSSSEPA